MLTVTTHQKTEGNAPAVTTLYVAFELGEREWKLAFTPGLGQRPRHRTIRARDLRRLDEELGAAKRRFHLAPEVPVRSCYEAGREGFWLPRALTARGIVNVVVDASSIEVNRRARRAKADRLDAEKLVEMLVRYAMGGRRVWHVMHVPSEAAEDRRHLERERRELGISKSGNPQLRALMVELAWLWLRYQPESALSRWYEARFAGGGPRLCRIGIVALARKLLIALWRYVEFDEVPAGAVAEAKHESGGVTAA